MNHQAMKSQTTAEFLTKLFFQLGQDIGLHWMDFKTLSVRCHSEGLPFFTKTLPLLSKAMIKGLATGRLQLPSNFKRKSARSALPAFLGSHFARVFHQNGELRQDACPIAVRQIRQFCEFAYKADLPRKEADDLAVVEKFVSVEDELSSLEIPGDPLLVVSNALAHQLFSDFDRTDLNCKHGPGVTANVEITEKFDHQLTPGLKSVSRFGEYFFFNENDALTRLDRYPVYTQVDYFRSRNVAKVILVPKDSRGPRLISCEPAENQFVQQGIANYMVNRLESHPLTAGHINFRDQSINRTLAQEHSVSLQFSTLDLKDASDRVSMALVERIFQGLDLLTSFKEVRSSFSQLPELLKESKVYGSRDPRIFLHKHAPMGSALCFPVMACSIYLLLIAGIVGLGHSLGDAINSVYVYGDDVIVRTDLAEFSIAVLERYGLKVNTDKSFICSRFLESCGMDAFDGQDVTPIRLRSCDICFEKNLLKEKPKILVSLTQTGNLLSASGYRRTSETLFQYSESWLGPLPFGHQFSPYICRWIDPSLMDCIPEANYVREGIRWFRRRNLQRYPLGSVMQAWAVRPVLVKAGCTIYGHFQRIWGQLGKYESILPNLGEFSLPRQYVLSQKVFDHYSMRSLA